jgi:hypothetical protein
MSLRSTAAAFLLVTLVLPTVALAPGDADAWGNGTSASATYPAYGVHDMTADNALRNLQLAAAGAVSWESDWYIHSASDYQYSFNASSTRPTDHDNFLAYTDDPDSYYRDWDNHTHFLNRPSATSPSNGDAARRVSELYNLTRDELLSWMLNGSVQWDERQHSAAYHGGLMAHYLMDVSDFGHTDYTRLDHKHPAYDPDDGTYHAYYESLVWNDDALALLDEALRGASVPGPRRLSDPWAAVDALARYVNSRNGTTVELTDSDSKLVTVGSDYAWALTTFVSNWGAGTSFNGMRGYDEALWNYTLENLVSGISNLTSLWYSAYQDARDLFMGTAPNLVLLDPWVAPWQDAVDGDNVTVGALVGNSGDLPAVCATVGFYVDLERVNTTVVTVDPYGSVPVAFAWTATAGVHELMLIADALYRVAESNETDNTWWWGYAVGEERHRSRLTAVPTSLELLQESTGSFNLTLANEGNRPETYLVMLSAEPGAIDFSVTIMVDDITLDGGASTSFAVDVACPLELAPGQRAFAVVAVGRDSSASVALDLRVVERQVAPFIVLEHEDYANVSVPLVFDASASWDHNGDSISFEWDFGDGGIALGPVVSHAYAAVGIYQGVLDAFDGTLHRRHVFEVSVIDALPPTPVLGLLDVDMDAARVGWGAWRSEHYFASYRIYVSTEPQADDVFQEGNLAYEIARSYADTASIRLPWGEASYVGLEVVNTLGLAVRSSVLAVVPQLRVVDRPGDDPSTWVTFEGVAKHSFEARWPMWDRLVAPPSFKDQGVESPVSHGLRVQLLLLDRSSGGQSWVPHGGVLALEESAYNWTFSGLPASVDGTTAMVVVEYFREGAATCVTARGIVNLPPDLRPTVTLEPLLTATMGIELSLEISAADPDGRVVNVTVDWGDGSPPTVVAPTAGKVVVPHIYAQAGAYIVNVTALDDEGAMGVAGASVQVEGKDGGDGGEGLPPWMLLVAAAVVVLILVLSLIMRRTPKSPRETASRPLGPPKVGE